ncbi:Coiled-coil domain-containing protein 166 [Geodia barretti]|nr:Coiled-coil domain-containing protein 166 [Geodia barretti]
MVLLEKEQELSRVEGELEKLQPFKEQQVRQEQEISSLERELEEARFCHENYVRQLKTQFLQERRAYDAQMATRVRVMTQRASQQASKCLEEHTVKIRSENKQLRAELKQLIETTNDLQLQKKRLSRQYNTLLREHQLNQDLQRLSVYGTTRSTGWGRGNEGGRNGRTLPEISSPHTSSVLQ